MLGFTGHLDPDGEGEEVTKMATGSSFAGMHGWVAPSKVGTTEKETR